MQVVKSLLLLASFIVGAISFGFGQLQKQPPLALVLMEMAAHDRYESGSIGFAALKSKQYELFEQLTAIATEEQLMDLATNHTNGVVRLYALEGLQQRKVRIPEKLMEKFKNDTTKVRVFIGCVMDVKPISTLVRGSIIRNNSLVSQPPTFPIKQ